MCELIQHKVKVIFCDRRRNPWGGDAPGTAATTPAIGCAVRSVEPGTQGPGLAGDRAGQDQGAGCPPRPGRSAASADQLPGVAHPGTPPTGGHAPGVLQRLFGLGFSRDGGSPVNGALNYGYSLPFPPSTGDRSCRVHHPADIPRQRIQPLQPGCDTAGAPAPGGPQACVCARKPWAGRRWLWSAF